MCVPIDNTPAVLLLQGLDVGPQAEWLVLGVVLAVGLLLSIGGMHGLMRAQVPHKLPCGLPWPPTSVLTLGGYFATPGRMWRRAAGSNGGTVWADHVRCVSLGWSLRDGASLVGGHQRWPVSLLPVAASCTDVCRVTVHCQCVAVCVAQSPSIIALLTAVVHASEHTCSLECRCSALGRSALISV